MTEIRHDFAYPPEPEVEWTSDIRQTKIDN